MTDASTGHDREDPPCPDCGGDAEWVACEGCGGEGVAGHDCGEDTCCCVDPQDNLECQICEGWGGWWSCVDRCDS